MLKNKLAELLTQAALEAQKSGKLPAVTLPEICLLYTSDAADE